MTTPEIIQSIATTQDKSFYSTCRSLKDCIEKRPIGVERSKDCVPGFSVDELPW